MPGRRLREEISHRFGFLSSDDESDESSDAEGRAGAAAPLTNSRICRYLRSQITPGAYYRIDIARRSAQFTTVRSAGLSTHAGSTTLTATMLIGSAPRSEVGWRDRWYRRRPLPHFAGRSSRHALSSECCHAAPPLRSRARRHFDRMSAADAANRLAILLIVYDTVDVAAYDACFISP